MEELKQLRKKAIATLVISISVIILAGLFVFLKEPGYSLVMIPLILIPIFVFLAINKKFNSTFKEEFVKNALESVFGNLVFDPNRGIDRNTIANTGMIYMGNRFSSNDLISGTYKDVKFIQSDVIIQDVTTHTDSEGHTHTDVDNILIGKWMIFDFNKSFAANIQVKSKFFSHTSLVFRMGESKYKTVKMEDEDFNKRFSVHAQSEHDAFYILTPQFMEKIKNLSNGLRGKVMFCFIDNKLHIALNNNRDSFEYGVFKRLDESVINEYVSQEIKIITDFVDKLSLENDIFKKEG